MNLLRLATLEPLFALAVSTGRCGIFCPARLLPPFTVATAAPPPFVVRRAVDTTLDVWWIPYLGQWDTDAFGPTALPFSVVIDRKTGDLTFTCKQTGLTTVIPVDSVISTDPSNPEYVYRFFGFADGLCCDRKALLTFTLQSECGPSGLGFGGSSSVLSSHPIGLSFFPATRPNQEASTAALLFSGVSETGLNSDAMLGVSGSSARPLAHSLATLSLKGSSVVTKIIPVSGESTLCCTGILVPDTLFVTFTGAGGCLDGLTIPIHFIPGSDTPLWSTPVGFPVSVPCGAGVKLGITLECAAGPQWILSLGCFRPSEFDDTATRISSTCSPFSQSWHLGSNAFSVCFVVAYNIAITP